MQSARGPNMLNMMNYMQGQQEQQQDYEEQGSSRPNIDPKAIEDQFDNFVKEMQKYDQILSQVAKNIQQVDGQRDFITDFYPKFIWESTYEDDQETKIITNTDPQLAKIIQNLQRSNKILKDDMRAWVLEFAKTAKNTEILIKQNKILRQSIVLKNKEIVKLIEGIGQAQNEEITQLTENLQLLKEQNGVLKEHLLKLKQDVVDKKQEQQRVQSALQKLQNEYKTLEKTKNEVQDEEQHLSKTFQLIQQWRNQIEKRKRKLQKEKDNLLQKRSEYQDEKGRIQRQLQLCSKQKRDLQTGLKKECFDQQSEKYRLIHQITDLGDMISKQKQESRYFEEESNRNVNKKLQYQKISKEYAKKVEEGQQRLNLMQKEIEKSQELEVGFQCQIELEKYDVELLKKELSQLEEKERNFHTQWKIINKRNQEAKAKQITEWQAKVNQSQRELAMKILQQKSELSSKQKQLQRWEQKVYDKKQELTDLKAQMKEIKENQIRLAELKSKLANQEAR